MKILHINASYKPAFIYGGPTMSVSMLCEQLVKVGVTVNVFTTTANGHSELPVLTGNPIITDGVQVTYFERITKDHTHFSPALLSKLWRQVKNYDAIHIHAWWNMVSVVSAWVAIKRRIPVILSPRGTLSVYSFGNRNAGIKKIIHQFLGKHLLEKCYLHVTSKSEECAILQLLKPKGIFVIPNLVRLPDQSTTDQPTSSQILKLIFFSRIEEKKRLDILIRSLTMLRIPYQLTVAGAGDERYVNELKGLAEANGVADKINWMGFISEDKYDMLRDHDLFVLPSHDENFGNAVIESLVMGTAVLISEHVGLADYVKENAFGWVCEMSPEDIARQINNIWNEHKDDLSRIRTFAPGKIYADLDPANLVQQYTGMYENVIGRV